MKARISLSLIIYIFLITTLAKGNQVVPNHPDNPFKDTLVFIGHPFRFVVRTDSCPDLAYINKMYVPDSSKYHQIVKSVSIFNEHNEQLIQTIVPPENYLSSESDPFIPADLNFDGYSDFMVFGGWAPPDVRHYYFWIFDTASKQFIRDTITGSLSCPRVYPDSQIVTAYYIACCGVAHLETYKFLNRKLTKVKEIEQFIHWGRGQLITTTYKVENGLKIKVDIKTEKYIYLKSRLLNNNR